MEFQVHQMFRERMSKSDKSKVEGVWSAWSPWTPCSRSCGGGVTQQIRHCVPKPPQSRLVQYKYLPLRSLFYILSRIADKTNLFAQNSFMNLGKYTK